MDIIYQDAELVAINKPAGLLVHPSLIDRRELLCAMKLLRDQLGRWVYPIHRLDKPTSGVLLFALSRETAGIMAGAFAQQQVHKTYLAVVRGFTDSHGIIDHPLREQLDKMTDRRAREDKPPQSAATAYHQLAKVELPYPIDRYATSRYSLVALHPRTGRKHQVRRHMKHISHPIVGDTSYGKSLHNRLFRDRLNCSRLLLSAVEMTFVHPVDDKRRRLVAPLDECFSSLLRNLGWQRAVKPEWVQGSSSPADAADHSD